MSLPQIEKEMKEKLIWFSHKTSSFTLIMLHIIIFSTVILILTKSYCFFSMIFLLLGFLLLIPSIRKYTKRIEEIIQDPLQNSLNDERLFLRSLFVLSGLISSITIVVLFLCFQFYNKELIGYGGALISLLIMLIILWIGKIIFDDWRVIAKQGIISYEIILFCLGTFICISNILAFSIGIFDQANDKNAIYCDVPDKNNNAKIELSHDTIVVNKKITKIKLSELKKKIYFREGSSMVELRKSSTPAENNEDRNNRFFICKEENNIAFIRIKEIMDTLSCQKNVRFRISLIGHADDNPLGENNTRYRSNYELSLARIQNVQYKLMNDLSDKADSLSINGDKGIVNTEWLLNPLSNEPKFEFFQPKKKSLEDKRIVEINISPVLNHSTEQENNTYRAGNQLKLFDYIYFMFYTITTTGYGDIKPVATFVKFCTTLANLYELIFMVVFFNILLGIKHREQFEAAV